MDQIFNGMPTASLPAVAWQRSRRSNASGSCVEMAELPGGAGVAIQLTAEISTVDSPDMRSPPASTVMCQGSLLLTRTRYWIVTGTELMIGTVSGSADGNAITDGLIDRSIR